MQFLIPPYPHQLEALEKFGDNKCFAFLWEMGTGKTGGVINFIRKIFTQRGSVRKTLIISPPVTLHNWKSEFSKFSKIPQEKIFVLDGVGQKKISNLQKILLGSDGLLSKEVILLINYETLLNETIFGMLCEWCPEILVGDEMHYMKSRSAKRSKLAVQLADLVRDQNGYVFGLTGTAVLNSIEDVYMQWRYLDGGATFGRNFFVFRNTYLIDENAKWAQRPGYFPKWRPKPELFDELHNKLFLHASRVTKEQCLKDLPPLIKMRRVVELGPEQEKAYKDMKRDFVAYIESNKNEGVLTPAIAQLALTKALRLQQIVCGHITLESGEVHRFEKNPRLDQLEELIDEITPNNKLIIWCCFKMDFEIISKLLTKKGIDYVGISGAQGVSEKQEAIDRFSKNPACRVVVGNRKAAGIGINLVAAGYSIVYSRNASLGEEKQSEARNHRGGSQIHEQVIKIDLVAKDTIDELILSALENKQQLSDLIIDFTRK